MRRVISEDGRLLPINAVRVYKGVIFDVYQWQQSMFDSTFETFEMLKRADSVSIIGIYENKIITMDEQQPGEQKCVKFPGGMVDPGESQLEAAQREMFEETGMHFRNWKLVNVYQPYNKIEWFMCKFIAFDSQDRPKMDLKGKGEKARLNLYEFNELKKMVAEDQDGDLKYDRDLFRRLDNLNDLMELTAFKGKVIDI